MLADKGEEERDDRSAEDEIGGWGGFLRDASLLVGRERG